MHSQGRGSLEILRQKGNGQASSPGNPMGPGNLSLVYVVL